MDVSGATQPVKASGNATVWKRKDAAWHCRSPGLRTQLEKHVASRSGRKAFGLLPKITGEVRQLCLVEKVALAVGSKEDGDKAQRCVL